MLQKSAQSYEFFAKNQYFCTKNYNVKITVEFVSEKFAEYNAAMFAGRLPLPQIELTTAKTFLGQCCSKVVRLADGRRVHSNFRLRFSTYFDVPQRELEDTVIHEMIHYFITFNGLCDSSTHGEIFKSLMRSLNTTFGRNVSVSHRGDTAKTVAASPRKRHVVARVELTSGKVGFKVLPLTGQSINKFVNGIRRSPDLRDLKLYVSTNPFFHHYPSSAALKIHIIDAGLLDTHLADAENLLEH